MLKPVDARSLCGAYSLRVNTLYFLLSLTLFHYNKD